MIPTQRRDLKNSTDIPGAFTGEWVLEQDLGCLQLSMKSDTSGSLYFELFDQGDTVPVSGTTPTTSVLSPYDSNTPGSKVKQFNKGARWHRLRYVPDTTPTQLRIDLYLLRQLDPTITALNRAITTSNDAIVVRSPNNEEAMKERMIGERFVIKYCRNPLINTASVPEDIWNGGGLYPGLPTTAAEQFEAASTSTSDTAAGIGARVVRAYYLDDDYNAFDVNGNFLYVDITLNGTTYVPSGVTGMRVWRVEVVSSGSNQVNVGDITVRWRTTTTVIFAIVPATFGETQISNFTVPAGYTGYIREFSASMNDQTANKAEVSFVIRTFGTNTFSKTITFTAATDSQYYRSFKSGLKVTEKSDILMRVNSVQANGANVNGVYELHLIKNL